VKVAQRLFLAVVPAVVGIFLVAGLSYWGRFAYVVPEWVLTVAIVGAALSLVVSWMNTRYIARRIDRLAARVGESPGSETRAPRSVTQAVTDVVAPREAAHTSPDELDAIEQTVDRLSSAVSDAEAERRAQVAALDARKKEYAELVSRTAASVARALDDVQLPLHILLENRFGELNENQEEMLGAARASTENAATEVAALRDIADFDRGTIAGREDAVRINDVLSSLTPMLIAEGELRDIVAHVDVAPGLPAIRGDRRQIQESVSAVLLDTLRGTPAGSAFSIEVDSDAQSVRITVTHGGEGPPAASHALPKRLLSANRASLTEENGKTVIRFVR
jgi:signal transduction histidine kinase